MPLSVSLLLRVSLQGAIAAALLACAPNRPSVVSDSAAAVEADYVNAGIYEASDPSNPRLRIRLFLSPSHGFILRKTLGKNPLIEYRGQWKSDPDSLRLQVWDVRRPGLEDSALVAERLDTVIACPIQNGAAQPVPLLRLGSPKGGPRLVQLSKPPETGLAWNGEDSKSRGKLKKGKQGSSNSRKGRSAKDTPPPTPAASKEKTGAVPES